MLLDRAAQHIWPIPPALWVAGMKRPGSCGRMVVRPTRGRHLGIQAVGLVPDPRPRAELFSSEKVMLLKWSQLSRAHRANSRRASRWCGFSSGRGCRATMRPQCSAKAMLHQQSINNSTGHLN